jgi:hypothetical protein
MMKKNIIFKNFHYSTFIPLIKCVKKNVDYVLNENSILFDESCKYEIDEKSCVNKLFGYSFHIFNVHKNSCRFGWTYDKEIDKIVIWTYTYNNGKLFKNKIGICDFNKVYNFSIKTQVNTGEIIYNFNNEKEKRLKRTRKRPFLLKSVFFDPISQKIMVRARNF